MTTALLALAPGWLLMLFRTGGMVFSLPFFGRADDSRWARLVIVVGMGSLLYLPDPALLELPRSLVAFGVTALREVLVGLLLGLGIGVIFGAVRLAGEVIGHEMGLTMSQVVDPATGAGAGVIGTFFETLAMLFFLLLDGHHQVFRLLARVNTVLPLGEPFDTRAALEGFTGLSGLLLERALLISAPVFAIMLVLTVTMLLLSRAVPQIHLMEFGFALRIVVALLGCIVFVPRLAPVLEQLFVEVIEAAGAMVARV